MGYLHKLFSSFCTKFDHRSDDQIADAESPDVQTYQSGRISNKAGILLRAAMWHSSAGLIRSAVLRMRS